MSKQKVEIDSLLSADNKGTVKLNRKEKLNTLFLKRCKLNLTAEK